ncbi:MAG: phosphonate metabolism protein/1,5-bisphosphokinase (PRPP-forming) PhnN [Candidatus Muproteobacteria bacterium RBG_16_64_11]|uniref:Ribose 1,5-bisphosphate phosphokinase PhnN n=1 Tax=Candidatus Muproteobacteria bacterium RBG_16_64_11 TaxID=1817758 RepID=A0A1F6TFW7_9PROT|nr:MAG: phosphonate metabolism protein/1,5-bisphosphokinase (PRPP-forming) PhnN [Candidatus Muproteobacteria bacterium RBG_16_64_11]
MPDRQLYYVIGASGSGKDSIMGWARAQLAGHAGIVFAHRYITRPAAAGGENHVALTEAEFDARLAAGLFAMHWASHGWRYGIGNEINLWLARGLTVVLNGSREYLGGAAAIYPGLTPVLIEVPPEILRQRLLARGRETPERVAQRIERASTFADPHHPGATRIRNDTDLESAGRTFVNLLLAGQRQHACG